MAGSGIEGGLAKAAVARDFHTTPRTVAKWIERSASRAWLACATARQGPNSSPSQDSSQSQDSSPSQDSRPGQAPPAVCAAVEALRRQRHTGAQIGAEVGVSPATVSRILKRLGLNRLSALEPANRSVATNGQPLARSSTSTSKSWASSVGPAIGSPAIARSKQDPRRRPGICASGDRRPFPSRLFGNPAGRKTSVLPAFPVQRPAPLSRLRRQG